MRVLAIFLLAACGGSAPAAAPKNPATLMGGCDAPDGERVLRARLDLERGDGSLAVDGQTGGACAVYKLTPGEHQVTLTATGPAAFGIAASLQAVAGGQTYDVFDLHCGLPGSCDNDSLRAWQKAIEADRTQMTDPCAALKLTNLRWETQQLDEVHPKALTLSFVLHVYSKPSGKPPHDKSCPEK